MESHGAGGARAGFGNSKFIFSFYKLIKLSREDKLVLHRKYGEVRRK